VGNVVVVVVCSSVRRVLVLPEYHTSAAAATVRGFHSDRLIIMGCGTPSSPSNGPDVRQRD